MAYPMVIYQYDSLGTEIILLLKAAGGKGIKRQSTRAVLQTKKINE